MQPVWIAKNTRTCISELILLTFTLFFFFCSTMQRSSIKNSQLQVFWEIFFALCIYMPLDLSRQREVRRSCEKETANEKDNIHTETDAYPFICFD